MKQIYSGISLLLFLLVSQTVPLLAQKISERSKVALQYSKAKNSFLKKNYQSASKACNIILKNKYVEPVEIVNTSYIKSASELNLGNPFQASFYFSLAQRIIDLYDIEYSEAEQLELLKGQLRLSSKQERFAITAFRKTKDIIEDKLKEVEDDKTRLLLEQRLALCLTYIGDFFINYSNDPFEKAIQYHTGAEELLNKVEQEKKATDRVLQTELNWSRTILHINYATAYSKIQEDSLAIAYLNQAKTIASNNNFRELKVKIGNLLGAIYEEDSVAEAKKNYIESLEELATIEEANTQRKEAQIKLMRLLLESEQLDSLGVLLDAYDESPIINDSLEIADARTVEALLAREIKEKLDVSRRNEFLTLVIFGILLFALVGWLLGVLYFMLRSKNRQLQIAQAELEASQKDLREKNAALEQSLKDLVLSKREMNHRVKNTLQLIVSIIMSYQREDRVKGSVLTSGVLHETRNKIETILLLHNQLSGRRNNGEINLQEYLNNLSDYLKKTLLYREDNFFAEIEVEEVPPLHLEKAQNIGLAITELAINSYKYSPAEDKWLRISAKLPEPGLLHVVVEDNGKELAKKSISTSLGLKIIREIIKRQFKGEFIDPDGIPGKNTKFEVKIPIKNLQ